MKPNNEQDDFLDSFLYILDVERRKRLVTNSRRVVIDRNEEFKKLMSSFNPYPHPPFLWSMFDEEFSIYSQNKLRNDSFISYFQNLESKLTPSQMTDDNVKPGVIHDEHLIMDQIKDKSNFK